MRFYIVPEVEFTIPGSTMVVRGPKYIGTMLNLDGTRLRYEGKRYGLEETYLVGTPVTDAQHAILDAQSDVVVIPENLDATIPAGALTTVRQRMAAMFLPSNHVTTAWTWRQLIRWSGGVFTFAQRFNGRHVRRIFSGGAGFATRMNQLTQAQRDALTDVAAEFNLDTLGVTGTTTIEQVLVSVGNQMPSFSLMGEVF